MKNKDFKQFRDEFITEAMELSDNKSIEYTISNESKLYNFVHVAERLGITPQQSLMTYLLKHVDAICNEAKTGKVYSDEAVRSRCLDIVNYMVLYAALHKHTNPETQNDNNTKPVRNGIGSPIRNSQDVAEPNQWSNLKRSTKT
tara:strand:+ start:420 stop:851 length:432 start_codon:yes stop_codon:yes gene_type:complete